MKPPAGCLMWPMAQRQAGVSRRGAASTLGFEASLAGWIRLASGATFPKVERLGS